MLTSEMHVMIAKDKAGPLNDPLLISYPIIICRLLKSAVARISQCKLVFLATVELTWPVLHYSRTGGYRDAEIHFMGQTEIL